MFLNLIQQHASFSDPPLHHFPYHLLLQLPTLYQGCGRWIFSAEGNAALALQAWTLIQRLNIWGPFRRMVNRVCWRFCKTFLAPLLLYLDCFTSKTDNHVSNILRFCTLNGEVEIKLLITDSSFHKPAHESRQHILNIAVVLLSIYSANEVQ